MGNKWTYPSDAPPGIAATTEHQLLREPARKNWIAALERTALLFFPKEEEQFGKTEKGEENEELFKMGKKVIKGYKGRRDGNIMLLPPP